MLTEYQGFVSPVPNFNDKLQGCPVDPRVPSAAIDVLGLLTILYFRHTGGQHSEQVILSRAQS
jgi:hypothetical protein